MKNLSLPAFFLMLLTAVSGLAQAADNIARSTFTSGVENREPVDKVGQLSNDNEKIYFFTEIRGMAGHTVTHRWEHGGETRAEVSFKVGADRWRVWSSKNLQPQWLGEWIVTVVDDAGNTLAEESMAYVPAAKSGMPMGDNGMHDGDKMMESDQMMNGSGNGDPATMMNDSETGMPAGQ